jgi:hypothetical protein
MQFFPVRRLIFSSKIMVPSLPMLFTEAIVSTGHHYPSGEGVWGNIGNRSARIDVRKVRNCLLAGVSQTCCPNVLGSCSRLERSRCSMLKILTYSFTYFGVGTVEGTDCPHLLYLIMMQLGTVTKNFKPFINPLFKILAAFGRYR